MESNALVQSTIKDDKELLNRFLQDKNIDDHRKALFRMLEEETNDMRKVNEQNKLKLTKTDLRIINDTLIFNTDSNGNESYKLGVDIFDAIRYLSIQDNIISHFSDVDKKIECEKCKRIVEQLILNLLRENHYLNENINSITNQKTELSLLSFCYVNKQYHLIQDILREFSVDQKSLGKIDVDLIDCYGYKLEERIDNDISYFNIKKFPTLDLKMINELIKILNDVKESIRVYRNLFESNKFDFDSFKYEYKDKRIDRSIESGLIDRNTHKITHITNPKNFVLHTAIEYSLGDKYNFFLKMRARKEKLLKLKNDLIAQLKNLKEDYNFNIIQSNLYRQDRLNDLSKEFLNQYKESERLIKKINQKNIEIVNELSAINKTIEKTQEDILQMKDKIKEKKRVVDLNIENRIITQSHETQYKSELLDSENKIGVILRRESTSVFDDEGDRLSQDSGYASSRSNSSNSEPSSSMIVNDSNFGDELHK